MDKVFEEDRVKIEEEEKKKEALRPKVSWIDYLKNISKVNFNIYLSICFVVFTLGEIWKQIYSSSAAGSKGLGI